MKNLTIRTLLGIAAPLVWSVLAFVPMLWMWERMPEPMASHWSFSGSSNGALPRAAVVAIHGLLACAPAAAAFTITRRAPSRHGEIAPTLATCAFFGVFAAGLSLLVVALNLDAPSWGEARSMRLDWLGALLAMAALAAAATRRAARALSPVEDGATFDLPTVGLTANERAFWSGAARNRWLGTIGIVTMAGCFVFLTSAPVTASLALLVSGIAVVTFSVIRVRIDAGGILIAYGPLAIPFTRIPLSRIREARAFDLAPLLHGGWGYRGSLWLFGRAAIVVRAGQAIELRRHDGRTLCVTVDDARTGAGLLNDLVARAGHE